MSLAEIFAREIGNVGGSASLVDSTEAAVGEAVAILKGHGARLVAIAAHENRPELERKLSELGITTVANSPQSSARLKEEVARADAGVTGCDLAIANTGTLVLVTDSEAQRMVSALPRIHVCLLDERKIVSDLYEAMQRLRGIARNRSSVISFISGPSRTGDIESVLSLGVHGPHVVHAVVVRGR